MTDLVPAPRQFCTDGLIALLRTIGKPVGDGIAPSQDSGEHWPIPFYIVYPVPGEGLHGSAASPHEDGVFMYQIRCVGETRVQVEALADRARDRFLRRGPGGQWVNAINAGAGYVVHRRDIDSLGGIEREGAIFNLNDTYVIGITST